MTNYAEIVGKVTLTVLALVGLALLFTVPVWLLWNWLMPTIFGLPQISIFQTLGLLLLIGFLFNSISN